jgi:hypothetical protein
VSVYLIEVEAGGEFEDIKSAVLGGPITIGPFSDTEAAEAFANEVGLGENCYRQGGYSTYHIIGDGSEQTPEQYREEWADHIEYALEDRARRWARS